MKRHVRVLFILGIVGLIGIGLFSISRGIVNIGYSSEARLVEENMEKKEKQNKVETGKKFVGEVEDGYSMVERIFDDKNLEERRSELLQESESIVKGILDYIRDVYKERFESLEVGEWRVASDADYILSSREVANYDWYRLQQNSLVYVSDGAFIIDMFDATYVVYGYNYLSTDRLQLFVVDYSKSKMNVKNNTLFDFGQEKGLLFYPELGYYENVDGVDIIYFKEM